MEARFLIASATRDDMNAISPDSQAMKTTDANTSSIFDASTAFARYPRGRWTVPAAKIENPDPCRGGRALFPLTPTLSLGEREEVSRVADNRRARGLITATGLRFYGDGPTRHIQALDTQWAIHPLPKGEGRGEGELIIQPFLSCQGEGRAATTAARVVMSVLSRVFALLFLILGVLPASAQTGIDRLVIMAGTTTVDPQGRHWAYLVWQATEPASIRSRQFAIYAKAGDANSAALYERQAIIGIQTDPLVIQPLLQRSVHLGQDLIYLEETINNLFEKLMPDPTLPLAQKVSAVIRGSLENPDHFKNLVLMSRVHPAMGLCLGWAHAGLIPGPVGVPTTFELRVYDIATDRDLGVVGRTTVRAGQPVVLPAPGAPVEVRDVSPKGDLNAKIRWATPDDLRRLSMLQHGFNIYRVPKAIAEAHAFHLGAPSTAALLALDQANASVHRLNRVPVLNPRDYTAAEAMDFVSDRETFFFSDWNDRFNPNTSTPQDDFVNGAQFYYFLTARDLLGRDGRVSPGTLITICDRMPPAAPRRVQVVNHYVYDGGGAQHLQVIWNQNEITPLDTTTHYFIYRWTSLTQMHANAGDPSLNLVGGPIAHQPGSPTNSFVDDGFGAPSISLGDAGTTFWYTVVALDNGACAPGGNRSPHSAPSFGVLRDRVGPEAGRGLLEITCSRPVVIFTNIGAGISVSGLSTNDWHYQLITERNRPRIAWAEFFYEIDGITTQRVFVARQFFIPGDSSVVVDFSLPRAGLGVNASPRFHCRVAAINGKVSEFAVSPPISPVPDMQTRPVRFVSTIESQRTRPGGDCDVHDPHGGEDGTIDGICTTGFLTAGTKEVKFYRRVENGPLTLVCQKEADFDAGETMAVCCDGSMPAQPSDICYFIQLFDEHGNASAMVRIGCVKTGPNAPLPTPILSPIASLGTSTNARMRLQWFCPPYGVERFEVWIAGNPLPPNKNISSDMTFTNAVEIGVPLPGIVPGPKLVTFLTRRIGPSFGTGSVFTVEADVAVGNKYAAFIRAVGKDGSTGPKSNVEQFTWHTTPELPVTNVPWPARSLPAVSLTNFPGVQARMFHTNDFVFNAFPQQRFEGVGVRVGAVSMQLTNASLTNAIAGTADPLDHVYRSTRDHGLLFPLVVYRAQVPNAEFSDVSGDVVQVTPLMEQIAFDRPPVIGGGNVVLVHDPFIRLIPVEPTQGAQNWELYLLDTQPVVEDATYQYFLVRLDPETREITEVMPTKPVQILP